MLFDVLRLKPNWRITRVRSAHNAMVAAGARGWKTLVTPGIMCGILGYAVGTFIGVAVAKMLM